MTDDSNQADSEQEKQKLTLWQIIGSVLAAAFGVQSDANRRRDFTQAKPSTYIIAGILFTLLFVLVLVVVVQLVIGMSTG